MLLDYDLELMLQNNTNCTKAIPVHIEVGFQALFLPME